MRKKLLSLALALVMCLGLATVAMAAEVSNGKCTYELSNEPIGTAKIEEVLGLDDNGNEVVRTMTVYVVPDGTTVTSKTVPNGRMPYTAYVFKYNEIFSPDKFVNAGEAFAVISTYGDEGPAAYHVYSENLNSEYYDEEYPWETLDYDEGGICVATESAIKAAGLTVKAYSSGTPVTPNTPTVPTTPATGFTDVAADVYYAASVAWAIEKGITNGTGNNQFSPSQNCTNAQILTFLWRAYGQPEPTIGNPFTNSIADAYTKAAVWAYEKGMVFRYGF